MLSISLSLLQKKVKVCPKIKGKIRKGRGAGREGKGRKHHYALKTGKGKEDGVREEGGEQSIVIILELYLRYMKYVKKS